MIIRLLKEVDYEQAIDLKISCWDEELAGMAPNDLNREEELQFLKDWVSGATENNDIRVLYGAFDGDTFMGFAGGSIADETDSLHGMELNYLFVPKEYRGRGIALKLIKRLLVDFFQGDFKEMVVYNHHFAPSNTFYTNLGGKVLRKETQGKAQLEVDVFVFCLEDLKMKIEAQ
ncbi:GNAT family N-acetyltransferase [Evansella sp. AB-rgal1]|uniref:GNAT family N-acetyltransferase n=1 Tax=Evansella sp. AB-rgal1 TaxID=3242696 RepID=UPI00359E5B9A